MLYGHILITNCGINQAFFETFTMCQIHLYQPFNLHKPVFWVAFYAPKSHKPKTGSITHALIKPSLVHSAYINSQSPDIFRPILVFVRSNSIWSDTFTMHYQWENYCIYKRQSNVQKLCIKLFPMDQAIYADS